MSSKKTNQNTLKFHGHPLKLRSGEVPGPLGSDLGIFVIPKGAQKQQDTIISCFRTTFWVFQGRPKGAKLDPKIHIFPIFSVLFCDLFSDMRLGRHLGGFFIDFGLFLTTCFDYFCDVFRVLQNLQKR